MLPIRMKDGRQNADGFLRLFRLDAGGPGTIGKDDGGIAVLGGHVQKSTLIIGPGQQDFPGLAALDIGVAQFQAMQKTGALLADIQRRHVGSPQFMLQNGCPHRGYRCPRSWSP